jgi:hypothetical protein
MTNPEPGHYALTFTPVTEQPAEPAVPATRQPPLQVLFDGVTYHYAAGPGYFTRIESKEEYDRGLTAGLWGDRDIAITMDQAGLDAVKELCLRSVPKVQDPGPVEGGARVGRGYVYLDEFKGATPADQLRAAVTGTNQAIVPMPGTVIDVGADPILMTARKCIRGLGGPQNEFKSTWPVYFKGSKAALRNDLNGANYGQNKGWVLKDMCLVGQAGLPMIEQVQAANQLNYVGLDGCSFDTWNYVIDGPCLGLWIGGGIYTNNIGGAFAYRFKGSDCQIFTDGGKLDFGASFKNPATTAIICSWLEKCYIGPIYVTGDPARGLLVEGAFDRNGITFVGATFEGRNANAESGGPVVSVTGGGVVFLGCNFNFARAGREGAGIVNQSGGDMSLIGCRWRRGASTTNPEVVQTGGVADVSGARRVFTDRLPQQIEWARRGGTLLGNDGTVKLVA